MMKHVRRLAAASWLGLVATLGASDAASSPAVHEVTFECRVSSNNDGCEKVVGCPSGTALRTARAACNLEYGAVTDQKLLSVERGYIDVVRPSDHVDEARCWVGKSEVASGRAAILDIAGLARVKVGCQEHDRNGGDCHIKGSLYCETAPIPNPR